MTPSPQSSPADYGSMQTPPTTTRARRSLNAYQPAQHPTTPAYPPAPRTLDTAALAQRVACMVEEVLAQSAYNNLTAEEIAGMRTHLLGVMYPAELQRERQQLEGTNHQQQQQLAAVVSAMKDQTDTMRAPRATQLAQLTLAQLASHFPSKFQRDLATSITPLSTAQSYPVRQDLNPFWERATRALQGLGPEICVWDLRREHLRQVAPVILGPTVWEMFKHEHWQRWSEMEAAVDKRFGLTSRQVINAFYAMRPADGETEPRYLERVEDKRRQYNQDKEMCLRTFLPMLSLTYRRELERIRCTTAAVNGNTDELTWDMIVNDARARSNTLSVVPEEASAIISGFEPQSEQYPTGSTAALAHEARAVTGGDVPPMFSPKKKHQLRGHFHFQGAGFPKCELCTELGRDVSATHTLENCYVNPASSRFKRGIYNLRVAELKKQGKPLPEKMKLPEEEEQQAGQATDQKKDKQLLACVGDDLQALLNSGLGYHEALEQAMEANLGIEFMESAPDPMCVAFEADNLQAVGSQDVHQMRAIIARHLRALKGFSSADISAAAREIDQDDDDPPGMDVDPSYGEDLDGPDEGESDEDDDDEDDDIPLAQLQKKLDERLAKYQQAKRKQQEAKRAAKEAEKLKKKGKTLGQQVDGMRLMLPLLKGMEIEPQLTELLLSKVVLLKHERNEPVRVVEGSKVVQVSKSQMEEELNIFSSHATDDADGLSKALSECRLRHSKKTNDKKKKKSTRANYAATIIDELRDLLEEFTSSDGDADDPAPDKQLLATPVAAEKLPAGARGLPVWAPKGAKNGRGLLPISRSHYIALVAIGGGFCEAIVDTGGARSMIDYESAKALGLDVELSDGSRNFGSFWGPSGDPVAYYGRVKGPVNIQFTKDIVFRLPELKVIKHSEPLIIIGTDILMRAKAGWSFTYIGIHPESLVGVMVFNKGKEEATVEMVSWPKTVVQLPPATSKQDIEIPQALTTEPDATTVTSAADLLALIRQGRWVQGG